MKTPQENFYSFLSRIHSWARAYHQNRKTNRTGNRM